MSNRFSTSDCGSPGTAQTAPRVAVALAAAVLLLQHCHCRGADDWPFVRGPNFDGHAAATEIVEAWPDRGPPVLWSRRLGQGYSAFVASEDRVYTQAQNLTGQYLYCLAADTGETIWEYRYDWPYEAAGVYPGPRSTPTLSDGRVYFTSPDGLLGCVDQRSGRLQWSVDLMERYGIRGCDFGYACSPTVTDNMVILPVGGPQAGVVALAADSGVERWRSTDEPASYTPCLPIQQDGTDLVVCYMQNALLILDRHTGAVTERIELSQGYDEHSAWPIYREPLLWLTGPFRAGSFVLDLSTPAEAGTGPKVVWRSDILSNDVCSSVLVDNHIYGFDIFDVQSKTHRPSRGIFRCIEMSTGVETWSVGSGRPRRSGNTEEFASDIGQGGIVAADGKLIILNELGELILLKADPTRCVELARCSVLSGELTWTPPCLHHGRLYVRNQTQAVCLHIGAAATLPDGPLLRTRDLPRRQYHHLAAMLLAVEPEYAFDIPHRRWLIQWFAAGTVLLITGRLLAQRLVRNNTDAGRRKTTEFLCVLLPGAVGTTLLGNLTAEFVFTWPLCLYAALEFAALPAGAGAAHPGVFGFLRRRIPLLVLLCVCLGYFLICRRLSLVFEWAFLAGFPGALPVVWLANRVPRLQVTRLISRLAVSVLGFGCFFGTAVAFLKTRY
ncbi:MAG: PQQ-binding-like beta-propeller repeat protein [Fuerstiella sp.]